MISENSNLEAHDPQEGSYPLRVHDGMAKRTIHNFASITKRSTIYLIVSILWLCASLHAQTPNTAPLDEPQIKRDLPDTRPGWSIYDWIPPFTGVGACRYRTGQNLAAPRIEIHQLKKTGDNLGGTYRVRGVIEGVCLVEAGYYEEGRRARSFKTTMTQHLSRVQFDVRARGDKNPEIRAYNVNGALTRIPIGESGTGSGAIPAGPELPAPKDPFSTRQPGPPATQESDFAF